MTIEEKLKEYILEHYRSLLDFTQQSDIPYGTLQGVLKRGINNSSISTIIKICKALGISTDALAVGKIEPTETAKPIKAMEDVVGDVSRIMRNNEVTLDDVFMTNEEKKVIQICLKTGIEIIRGER